MQAIGMLKENRLISMISIIGTAVAIAMIMVVVFVLQIQWVNYYPEYHRDRTLQVQSLRVSYENGNVSGGSLGLEPVREIFYPLRSVEAVTAIAYTDRTLSLQGRRSNKTYRVKYVDDGFWKVFGFRFLEGKPFSEEEFLAKLPEIAANAEQDACTPENPRETKAADFEKILKACYYDTDIDF